MTSWYFSLSSRSCITNSRLTAKRRSDWLRGSEGRSGSPGLLSALSATLVRGSALGDSVEKTPLTLQTTLKSSSAKTKDRTKTYILVFDILLSNFIFISFDFFSPPKSLDFCDCSVIFFFSCFFRNVSSFLSSSNLFSLTSLFSKILSNGSATISSSFSSLISAPFEKEFCSGIVPGRMGNVCVFSPSVVRSSDVLVTVTELLWVGLPLILNHNKIHWKKATAVLVKKI